MIALLIELAVTGSAVTAVMAYTIRKDLAEARENGHTVYTLRETFRR